MRAEREPAELEVFIEGFQRAIDEEILAIQDDLARRGIAQPVAASGGHNILMIGPAGTGKTMMARALPGVLPVLTTDEALEVTRIY